jgi:hypothetical protein
MRRLLFLGAGLLTLTITGLAVAHGLNEAKNVRAVAGTFDATTVSTSQTRSCTTAEGKTIVFVNATYSGTASGDPDLTGPVTLQVRSTVDSTDGLGAISGRLRIAASGGDTVAHLDAVYDHGTIAGVASGHAQARHGVLLAALSAGFSATGGFTGGKIGGGTSGGSAVELAPARCAPNKPKPEKSQARGSVSAVSSTSITVAGLTCAVPSSLSGKVGTIKVGDRAEIRCALQNGVNTLVSINIRH